MMLTSRRWAAAVAAAAAAAAAAAVTARQSWLPANPTSKDLRKVPFLKGDAITCEALSSACTLLVSKAHAEACCCLHGPQPSMTSSRIRFHDLVGNASPPVDPRWGPSCETAVLWRMQEVLSWQLG